MIGQIQLYGIMFICVGFGLLGLAIALVYRFVKKSRREHEEKYEPEKEEEELIKCLLE